MKVFVPFSEALRADVIDVLGIRGEDLVPFHLDYQCVAVEFPEQTAAASLHSDEPATDS
tara:strand:- start:2257 stop:2433 length:177 start_codon:yes stop_codon:yes gene_type:complete